MGKKILIVATSHDKLGDSDIPTGCWYEEVAAPYYVFKEHGLGVDIASIKGGKIPFDPNSSQGDFFTPAAKKFLDDKEAVEAINNSIPLASVKQEDYDGVFFPGGHGVVYDAAFDDRVAQLLTNYTKAGKVVSAVCHGPAALVKATLDDGKSILHGKRCCGFTNAEEDAVQKTQYVPFLLEDRMIELGGKYEKGDNWTVKVVRDGTLVTGQNPQSSEAVAKEVVAALGV